MTQKTALIMAGGTGGHIFPGLAVAEELRARGWRVHWLGAPGSMESRIVPAHGFALELIDFSGVRGKGIVTLALLPLPPAHGAASRSALVWTLPPPRAGHLRDAPPAEFLAELQHCFGYRLGRLQQVGERHSYPLSLLRSREQVRSGVVVTGNAAHALHPVAGQGFNLALRDGASLAQVLAEGIAAGSAPGEYAFFFRPLLEAP